MTGVCKVIHGNYAGREASHSEQNTPVKAIL